MIEKRSLRQNAPHVQAEQTCMNTQNEEAERKTHTKNNHKQRSKETNKQQSQAQQTDTQKQQAWVSALFLNAALNAFSAAFMH